MPGFSVPCKAQSSAQQGILAVLLCPGCPRRAPVSQHLHVLLSHHLPRALPWHIYAQEHLPVIPAAVTVGVPEDLEAGETRITSGSASGSPPRLWAALTLPFFCSRCFSFLLMCRSMLVSPRVMRAACHSVRAPKASATELGRARNSRLQTGLLPWCCSCRGLRLPPHTPIGGLARLIPRAETESLLCGPRGGKAGICATASHPSPGSAESVQRHRVEGCMLLAPAPGPLTCTGPRGRPHSCGKLAGGRKRWAAESGSTSEKGPEQGKSLELLYSLKPDGGTAASLTDA